MLNKLVMLGAAGAVLCAYSLASPAYSVPAVSGLQADTNVTLVGRGDGDGGKKWDGGSKKWSGGGRDGKKDWSSKGGDKKWSGKGRGGKKWSRYGKWQHGQHHRGYWRNGVFVTLPFFVGNPCYDYLDWRDGAPRPGWYWVC
jgi:hypothetical protein